MTFVLFKYHKRIKSVLFKNRNLMSEKDLAIAAWEQNDGFFFFFLT